jgi:hypothetical protein
MPSNQLDRVLLGTAAVVAVIGAVDAAFSRDADLVALLVGLAVLLFVVLVRSHLARRSLPLRKDLVEWLEGRAVATGTSAEAVADRALASVRAEFEGRR